MPSETPTASVHDFGTQAHDVPEEDREDAEVEQRAAQAQQAPLVELDDRVVQPNLS